MTIKATTSEIAKIATNAKIENLRDRALLVENQAKGQKPRANGQ